MKLSEGDTPVTQHLRALEGRMQATLQRHDDTLAQRKTFEQIAKRLRDDRLGLQNQARGPAGSGAVCGGALIRRSALTRAARRSCTRWSATWRQRRATWRSWCA